MYTFDKKDIKDLKQYEDAFEQARLGYYRNMTSSRKNRLKEIVERNNGTQSVCFSCSAAFLNFLKRVGEAYANISDKDNRKR